MTWDMDATSPDGTAPAPAGVCVAYIEVATSPAEGTDGYFYDENRVTSAINGSDFNGCARQGEWLSSSALPDGVYYIHARNERESDYSSSWGATRDFTIATAPSPTVPPAATNARPRLLGKLLLCCEIVTARVNVCDPICS